MEPALYTVAFGQIGGPNFIGGGVLVLEAERAFGGDSFFGYLGTYSAKGSVITGRLTIIQHVPGRRSAWGDATERFEATFEGREVSDGLIEGAVLREGFGVPLGMKLTLLERLP